MELMDKVNRQENCNLQKVDSGEIVVSSIRSGMKREFCMMLKAQSEMGVLPAGRRVTRSQSAGSSCKGYVASDGKIIKKTKRLGSEKVKMEEKENTSGEDEGKLEVGGSSDRDKRIKRDVVATGSISGVALRSSKPELEGEKMRDVINEDHVQLNLESPLPQFGDSDGDVAREVAQSEMKVLPAGRRVTRSQSAGSSRNGYVTSDVKIIKKSRPLGSEKMKDGDENSRGEDREKLVAGGSSNGDIEAKRDVVAIGSWSGDELRDSESVLPIERCEAEKMGNHISEIAVQSLCLESPLPQVGYSDKDVIQEIDKSETGVLRAGRRVTRSQSIGISSVGYVESDGKHINKAQKMGAEKDEEESLRGGDGGKLEAGGSSEEDRRAKRDVVAVGSLLGDELRGSKPELLPFVRCEAEHLRDGIGADVAWSLSLESPLPQIGGADRDVSHDLVDVTVVDAISYGSERTEEASARLLEKPVRRFTRSLLKLQGEEVDSGIKERGEETQENLNAVTLTTSPSKLEMKMSKKVELKRIPTRLKDLLETGLLEGLHVRYIYGSKGRRQPDCELHGVIQGTGILCFCEECNQKKVVTPNQFELHANSGNKRPPEYIFLDNGKSLRDVLNACKADLSDSLQLVIQKAIGRSDNTSVFCLNCKGLIPEDASGRSMLLCNACVAPKESEPGRGQMSGSTHRLASSPVPVSSSCQPSVPVITEVCPFKQPQVKRLGKLTKKDLRMHRSVLSEDVLPDGTALSYVMHGKKRLEGFKKDGGIFCSCCNEVISPSQFEAHAGFASRRKPYMSIYTSNGASLHQISIELSKIRKSCLEENDDLCSICEDGGDLLCCENCPRAFHTICVGIPSIPEGTWYCKYCQNMFEKEKFAERDANAIAAGRVPGVDPIEEITQRCIRIIGAFQPDIGGCAICRNQDFSKSGFDGLTVIICDQCEKEYHVGCLKEQGIDDLKALPENEWFCCKECSSINSALQKLIGDGDQMLPETMSDILEKKSEVQDLQQNSKLDIRWRLLSGKKASEDTRVWLSGAVNIFHDRFDPISDASTGRLDLIPHMVYGRQFKDQDFCGMYCAVLMVNSVVVSAGIIRIFGKEVAELPLVATRGDCQGKGYFQSLFFCLEDLLTCLNVKELVLPAAANAESLWKNRFGFEKLDQEQLDQYKKSYQMMIFQGTSILHKSISKS